MDPDTAALAAALAQRYQLGSVIGRGGMATVFRAGDLRHERQVALKVLHPELSASVGAERFLREIRVMAHLQHPHILTLFDSGEIDGFLFYVMPYMAGGSLRRRLEHEGQLPLADIRRITPEVADALGYAHEHGVVHRDIKPENILFDAEHAAVADFGLALAFDLTGLDRVTGQGMSVGTPEYMSPEQASADLSVDHRSDLYSLGCVLYEMLAGMPPFTGPSARVTMARHVTDTVPSLRTARPTLTPGLVAVVEQILAKSPADRYASAGEFVQALAASDRIEGHTPTRSIAVLPFSNISPDPDNDFLADGMSEEIINALAQIEDFRVTSRTSAFAFKGSKEDLRAIGKRLGVRTVLEGSVRRAGGRLRVTAQLVNVADGYHLWSDRYDRDVEDVFTIQDEIAQNIARALQVVLRSDDPASRKLPTRSIRAYEHYLRGRQLLHQFRRKAIDAARTKFDEAIAIDSSYALAHAGLADCCSFLYMYWGAGADDLQRADRASSCALDLDPDLAEAHVSRGLVLFLQDAFPAAAHAFETAIARNPRLFNAYYFYARACFQHGEVERSVELFEQAAEIGDDHQARFFAAQSHAALGRDDDAHSAYKEALRAAEEHLDLTPGDARAVTMGAVALCRLGERARGLAWGERALAIDPDDAGVTYNVACLFSLEGETDRAIQCLEDAKRAGFWHEEWARSDPDLDPLRDDPRFQRLFSQSP